MLSPIAIATRLLSTDAHGTQIDMLRAYVGLISQRGLESLWPEFEYTHHFLARRLPRELTLGKLGFWAVLNDSAADQIRRQLAEQQHADAWLVLQCLAEHLGTIVPEEPCSEQFAGQYIPKI